MSRDILTVIRKEGLEFLHMRGSARGTFLMMVFPLFIIGVFLPLQFGRAWVDSPVSLLAWAWLPLLLTTAVIADSVAGERERHTLETLLASRLSDRDIFFGKLFASMLYALTLTALIILIGLVTVNLTHIGEGPLLFPPAMLLFGPLAALLGTAFASAGGILVSLRSGTVRQAQQTMSLGVVAVAILPGLLVNVLPPDIRASVSVFLDSADIRRLGFSILLFFSVLDLLLIAAAERRFRRTRLLEG